MPVNIALSRRTFCAASAFPERASASVCRALDAMFNRDGTAYAAPGKIGARAIEIALRVLVQRQRHPGEVLDSARDRRRTFSSRLV